MAELAFQTCRFDVFHTHVEWEGEIGVGSGRDVYMAWFREEAVPRSVCEVTLDESGYVEWIHVCEGFRRQGIATEVFRGLEDYLGEELVVEGVTGAGNAFANFIANEEQ